MQSSGWPNYAMQRSARVVTPLAGTAGGPPQVSISKRRAERAPPPIADVRFHS